MGAHYQYQFPVVRFLIHPLAGFITGEVIDQNGGLHFD
jgi:hypothetical protein